MKWYIKLASAVSFLLFTCLFFGFRIASKPDGERWVAPPLADTLKNPLQYNGDNISEGKKIFYSVCWTCHGYDGKGNGPASLNLAIKPADFSSEMVQSQTDGALFWKMSIGRGVMSSYSQTLNARQRWQLVTFLRGFKNIN